MKQYPRKDGTVLTEKERAEVKALLAKRRQPGAMQDEAIAKQYGLSLTALAAIAYGR